MIWASDIKARVKFWGCDGSARLKASGALQGVRYASRRRSRPVPPISGLNEVFFSRNAGAMLTSACSAASSSALLLSKFFSLRTLTLGRYRVRTKRVPTPLEYHEYEILVLCGVPTFPDVVHGARVKLWAIGVWTSSLLDQENIRPHGGISLHRLRSHQ